MCIGGSLSLTCLLFFKGLILYSSSYSRTSRALCSSVCKKFGSNSSRGSAVLLCDAACMQFQEVQIKSQRIELREREPRTFCTKLSNHYWTKLRREEKSWKLLRLDMCKEQSQSLPSSRLDGPSRQHVELSKIKPFLPLLETIFSPLGNEWKNLPGRFLSQTLRILICSIWRLLAWMNAAKHKS